MQNKVLLKHTERCTEKYGVLKLAKGVDLSTFNKKLSIKPHIGVSVNDYRHYWFVDSNTKERGVFKAYSNRDVLFGGMQNIRIANEMLCCELGKQIGVSVANYKPAHIYEDVGTISYDVTERKEVLVNACDFLGLKYDIDIENLALTLKQFCDEKNYSCDMHRMIFDLYKMLVFDTLTFQEDRHGRNIHFLINKKTKQVRLSPLIDNEFAFGGKLLLDYLSPCSPIKTDMDTFKFLEKHSENIFMFLKSDEKQIGAKKMYKSIVESLVKFSKKSKDFEVFLDNAIQNFDIKSAIQNVEAQGYSISDNYKKYLTELQIVAKERFAKTFANEVDYGK